MLDERGIEWRAVEGVDDVCTTVGIGNTCYTYLEHDFDFEITARFWCCYTPEQAIAATVGETCTMEPLFAEDMLEHECREYIMHCDACHHNFCYVLYNEDGGTWTDEPPKYCPHCGRRVVE